MKHMKNHIRHSASCEGVSSALVGFEGLFSVHLRDPRIPVAVGPGALRAFLF